MHACARTPSRAAFLDDIRAFGPRARLHFDDGPAEQRLDLDALLGSPGPGSHLYVCGPKGFMDLVTGTARRAGWHARNIHVEHFGAEIDMDGEPFMLVAARSGLQLDVPPGQSMASVLQAAGIAIEMSCQSGVCGTCLTSVLDGTPDHRDLLQTEEEKAANSRVTVCCSRSRTRTLTLDI